MKLENIVLILGGLACVIGGLFPYISVEILGQSFAVSGLEVVQMGLEKTKVISGIDSQWIDLIWDKWTGGTNSQTQLSLAGFIFICLGPIFFALYGLSYIGKGLFKKQFKRGILFVISYTLISWAIIFFLGKHLSLETANFFSMTGMGFWISFAGMWVAAFSLFFSKNL